jgi:uncharacterized protein
MTYKKHWHQVSSKISWPTLAALVFAATYPTALTLVYFQWLQGEAQIVQQRVYAFGKLIQFAFPILYLIGSSRRLPVESVLGVAERVNHTGNSQSVRLVQDHPRNNLALGSIFGLAVVAAMMLLYFIALPSEVSQRLTQTVQEKVTGLGMETPLRFLLLSLFYVVGHSFLEEYYWRWFVFAQLHRSMKFWSANFLAAFAFMAHHVVLLGFFFGWNSPFTFLFSASVAVGGVFWAWLFCRANGFRSAWLSHAIVDAGIFCLAMMILFR